MPLGYESNYLSKEILIGVQSLLRVEVVSSFRERSLFRVLAYCEDFDREIELVFFNFKNYMKSIFSDTSLLTVRGKVEKIGNKLNMAHPKVVSKVGGIEPKYKKSAIQSKTIIRLITKYVTTENLISFGVDEMRAKKIVEIHNPTIDFFSNYSRSKEIPKENIEALKFLEALAYFKKSAKKRVEFLSTATIEGDYAPFEKILPFALTGDQKRAIEDIRSDLSSTKASKRVVVGDVGCGKTMVILASVFMVYPKRSMLLAPTTILASQLYSEAKKYLPKHIDIRLVSKNSKESEEGGDFIIGTHALLYKEMRGFDLIMIDEQHRFGVAQRGVLSGQNSIEEKRAHVLQFSATPIPRTKALIDSALVDFSFIKELPYKKEIDTKIVSKNDFRELLVHINEEISKNHQVVIIYPLVEESENLEYKALNDATNFWKARFENVYSTHGKDRDKEKIIEEFREKGSILLATTVVEVGISLPKLTTIVISGADRLGLATLHQLRGRVSRNGLKGYCFLYTKTKEHKRLEEFCKTNDGFKIAEIDLMLRSSGDLFSGKSQSGKEFKFLDLSSDEKIIKEAKNLINL